MNGFRWGALACALAGGALLAYAAVDGAVRVGLFVIVPFVYATGLPATLGMMLLMAAAVLWFLGMGRDAARFAPPLDEADAPMRATTKSGGVVLIGPIPIVWGNDRGGLRWLVVAGAILLALGIAFSLARR